MNSLLSKIQEAANLFQTHDFKKSLQLYDQCINICKRNDQSKTLLHNLMSSKGALISILGDQKTALQCLNEVLKDDPYHILCLMRRSQVLKKKNKLNKALKDLKILSNFSPDNLQIAAMRIQIQNMKLKSKQVSSSSESESDNERSSQSDDADEQSQLNFSNLRMIDRKSVSLMIKPGSRKSRVTIAGDIAIEYEAVEDDSKDDKSFASTNTSKQYAKEKYIKTFRQIELDDQEGNTQGSNKSIETPAIKIKSITPRTKSILKNRDSMLYINNQKTIEKQKKYGGRESKMIDLLKNIDGKLISSTSSQRSSISVKEVQFRKSLFGTPDQLKSLSLSKSQNQSGCTKQKGGRKSCLKGCSFMVVKEQLKSGKGQSRRSRFDSMSMKGIDGIVIKTERNSIFGNDDMKDDIRSDSDSDQGSQHNIFGNRKIVISKQMRENLGLEDDSTSVKKESKPRAGGAKSILKKNSVLFNSTQKGTESSPILSVKKAKKSVMFTKTQ